MGWVVVATYRGRAALPDEAVSAFGRAAAAYQKLTGKPCEDLAEGSFAYGNMVRELERITGKVVKSVGDT